VTSGILNVNKPVGPSSFAVIRTLRRLPGVLKAGHGGTLDPAAEGVLPILINGATRLADFVHEWPKTYVATVTFGFTSDTGDREGAITAAGDAKTISRERIEAALPAFTGRIEQVPPMYSALKQGGEALYRKARRGETVERRARVVDIFSIRLLDYDAKLGVGHIEVDSGRGMYVRSLAQDLGAALGCGAYLSGLARTALGPLTLADAVLMATRRSALLTAFTVATRLCSRRSSAVPTRPVLLASWSPSSRIRAACSTRITVHRTLPPSTKRRGCSNSLASTTWW